MAGLAMLHARTRGMTVPLQRILALAYVSIAFIVVSRRSSSFPSRPACSARDVTFPAVAGAALQPDTQI